MRDMSKHHKLLQKVFAVVAFAALTACGGGGGSTPSEVPNTNNLAPANVKLLEVSSATVGQVTASWLPATDDATPASNLTYQLHAGTDAGFTPDNATKIFEGKDVYQANVVSGLTAGRRYSLKLVVVDGQGAISTSEPLNVTVSDTAATLNAGVSVMALDDSQVVGVNGDEITVKAAGTNLNVGQFVASAGGDTGNGFLKKIESVTTSNGNTVLRTRNASINEAVSDVKVSSSFKLATVAKDITNAAQQAGLVKHIASAQSPSNEFAWKQSGFRYQAADARSTLVKGLPEQWSKSVQAGLTQGDLITNQGSWGKLVLPKYIVVSEGEAANFNLHGYITDTSDPFGGDPRQICRMEFGTIWGKGDDANPSALNISVGTPTGNHWVDFRDTHLTYPTTLTVGAGSANTKPYTVEVKLRIEERGEGCGDQALWDETITETLTIYVVDDADAFREKEETEQVFTGSADFSVKNNVVLSFQPTLAFDKELSGAKLSYARIQLDAAPLVEQTLTIDATAEGSMDKTLQLMQPRKFYKVYMAGYVPIVITGSYTLNMNIKGNVSGELHATEKLTIGYDQLSYGLEFSGGQYKLIKNIEPTYRVNLGGNGQAEADLTITLEPGLELTAYEALTGRVILQPYLDANAGIEGFVRMDTEVDFNAEQLNMAADADYRLTKADIGGGVKLQMGADLTVWEDTLYAWPNKEDKSELKEFDLIERKIFWGIPDVNAATDVAAKRADNSRALLIKAAASPQPNLLKALFPSMVDTFVSWSKWTNPRIVPVLGQSATASEILPVTDVHLGDETWVVFNQPGTYTVRQGGYSSLGTWARQYVETSVEVRDENSNGIMDYWEERYGLQGTGEAIAQGDPDGDGRNNFTEWQNGTDPKVPDVSGAALVASPQTLTLGSQFQIWISQAWDSVVKVVYAIEDQSATVLRTATDTAEQAFVTVVDAIKVGVITVTADLFDELDVLVGSTSVAVQVSPATAVSVSITTAQDDRTDPAVTIPVNGPTYDATPIIRGAISAALPSGYEVRIFKSGSTDSFGVATVSGETWVFAVPQGQALAAGSHTFTAGVVLAADGSTPLGSRSDPYVISVIVESPYADVTTEVDLPSYAVFSSVVQGTVVFSNSTGAGVTATAVVGTVTLSNGAIFRYTVGDLTPGQSVTKTFTTTMPSASELAVLEATSTVATLTDESNTANNQDVDNQAGGEQTTPVSGLPGTGRLPHTGITASQCYAVGGSTLQSCSEPGALALNSQQDGHRANINAMSYSQVPFLGQTGQFYSRNACVKDNVTGLIWEGKTADNGMRDYRKTYTNLGDGNASDASGYVTWVNQNDPCPVPGYGPWRLPTVDELQSIVDYGRFSPAINTDWFINTSNGDYWSSSPSVDAGYAWLVGFDAGGAIYQVRGGYYGYLAVRLVRASQ